MYAQTFTLVGLNTLTFTLPETAPVYVVKGNLSCPQLSGGASSPSQVVVTVKQNGSTIYTGTAGATGFATSPFAGTFDDTIEILFTSSATVDTSLNDVKATIQCYDGF
jgi:hypothetical protein